MQDHFANRTAPPRDEGRRDSTTVVALFETLAEARQALEGLIEAGFAEDSVSLVASNAAAEHEEFDSQVEVGGERAVAEHNTVVDSDPLGTSESAAAGGGIGAAVGGVGGVLVGLGLLAIPGIGPALAAGPIVSGLIGAGIGGAVGSIAGALVNSGVDEERAGEYAEGVRRGGTLVVVDTTAAAASRAEEILLRHGSVDIEERARRWRASGWVGFDEHSEPYTAEEVAKERARHGADVGSRR